MAVKNHPLRIVSYSEPSPEIELNEDNFIKLEEAYGEKITPSARIQLIEKCNEFISLKRIEGIRQTWRDVENCLVPYKEAAQAMWKIAYAQDRQSDAYYEFERILEDVLKHQLVRFDAQNDLLRFDPNVTEARIVPLSDEYNLPNNSYFIRISDKLVQEIAMNLTVAVNAAEKRITAKAEEAGNDSQAAEPIEVLILSVTQWAKMFNLPISPTRNGGEPAPFAEFMTALLTMLPENFKENKYATIGGVIAKIGRVRRASRKRK